MHDLAIILEELYAKYNNKGFIHTDPVSFVHNYTAVEDMEIVALVASSLAYGRVAQIKKSADNLLQRMGNSPRDFIEGFGNPEKRALADFKHRFNTGEDFILLFEAIKKLLKDYGTLENIFLEGYSESAPNIIPALEMFISKIKLAAGKEKTRGFGYLLADPKAKSPCKRLNMFLRWVVRNDAVDLGLWQAVSPSKLIVPMDTHLIRLCRIIGLHDSHNVSLKIAVEVTGEFAKITPQDPTKYDFALSRVGIVENCNGIGCQYCQNCELRGYCK